MTDLRLIATDIDGTLIRSDGTLAPGGVAALRQARANGLHVVLATTRNPESTRAIAREIGLDGPLICAAGAVVLATPDGPTWAKALIPQQVARRLAQEADARRWELSISVGEVSSMPQRPGQPLGELKPGLVISPSNTDGVTGDVMRILTWMPEAIHYFERFCATHYAAHVHTDRFDNPNGTPHSLAIVASGADKGTALSLVLARLGIPAAQALAIGDNHNDLPLFAVAGVSVAVGNALPVIQAQADHVAPTNDDEGVQWAVERLAL